MVIAAGQNKGWTFKSAIKQIIQDAGKILSRKNELQKCVGCVGGFQISDGPVLNEEA